MNYYFLTNLLKLDVSLTLSTHFTGVPVSYIVIRKALSFCETARNFFRQLKGFCTSTGFFQCRSLPLLLGVSGEQEEKEPPFLFSKELELEWSSQSGCLQYSTTEK